MANKSGWGGARPGAGRKPGLSSKVAHRARPDHDGRRPLLITFKRVKEAPSLRGAGVSRVVHAAIRETAEVAVDGFRIVRFAISPAEVELIVEAADQAALAWGMRSVSIRMARRINVALARTGSLWSERYRTRTLATPRELRDATSDPKKQWVDLRAS